MARAGKGDDLDLMQRSLYGTEMPLLSPEEHDMTHDERLAEFKKLDHHGHHLSTQERELMKSYESLSYDIGENRLYRETQIKTTARQRSMKNLSTWVLFFLIGTSTGITAFLIETAVDKLSTWKFNVALDILPNGHGKSSSRGEACVAYVGMSMAFAFVSALLVTYLAPVAQGSGIPEVKAYLNGTNYPKVLRFPTLVAKAVGVVFSNSAGLAIGKEGPLIHSGSVWAAVYSHLPKVPKLCNRRYFKEFRTDAAKRDFVSGGAAAGVAAAFGAPMGGVLFSFEEASSFWSLALTWKVFFCAMSSTFALNICSSYYHGYKYLNSPANVDFGVFNNGIGYRLWEMFFFWVLAIGGGFAGALFNAINVRISSFRQQRLHKVKILKVVEVLLVMFVTAMCQFWAPSAFGCNELPPGAASHDDSPTSISPQHYKPYTCTGNNTYNEEATLIFTTGHDGIKAFFHDEANFSWEALLLYGCLYFWFAVVTYGIAVPSGLFVPCILTGSAFGRLMGNFVQWLFPHITINKGSYALIGAVAMLGGILRMTVSLCMIVIETTSDIQYLLPIMTTLMISKWVGDLFNISLYDLHIELKCVPFVEAQPPLSMVHLQAKDVMSSPVITFQQCESVHHLVRILEGCSHNGFPVVDPDEGNTLVGIITRAEIIVLLKKKVFVDQHRGDLPPSVDTLDVAEQAPRRMSATRRTMVDLEASAREPLPRHVDLYDFAVTWTSKIPELAEADLSSEDMHRAVDLRPWMNPAPYTVSECWPTSRVFRLFRAMGLRHLVVVNTLNEVAGIITRKEIRTDFSVDLS